MTFNLEPEEPAVIQDKNWQECTEERDLCADFGSKKMLDEFEKPRKGQHSETLELRGPRHK